VREHLADDWFVGFHVGLKAKFWRAASEPWADDDAEAIHRLLDLPAGARVLDAPCGAGRIAVRLAERGLEVTGIDIAAAEIDIARRLAETRAVEARFECRDIRRPPRGPFDAVVHWGNSFGYMPHRETIRHLRATRRVLAEGGRLLLESATVAETLLPAVSTELEYAAGGITMRGTQRYDVRHSRLVANLVFEDEAGGSERAQAIHHVHTSGEVVRMLEQAGFRVDELVGEPGAREPYAPGSRRFVAIATADKDLGRP
jgi:2-polyprenyl-3-methyl-5-hydroxy-6-metoxy-1,4-benzoquinol methylase